MFNKYFVILFYSSIFYFALGNMPYIKMHKMFTLANSFPFISCFSAFGKSTTVSIQHSDYVFQLSHSFTWLYIKIIFKRWPQRKYVGYQGHQVNNCIFLWEGS